MYCWSTSAEWAAERREFLKKLGRPEHAISYVEASGNIAANLLEWATFYDHVVVDVGAGDSEALRASLAVANYIVLPFRPKRRDLKTLPKVVELVEITRAVNPRARIRALVNQCPSLPNRVHRILMAKETIREWGIETLDAILFDRQVYDDADEDGATIWELDDPKAIADARSVYDELYKGALWLD
jgi:chromosome partitioning protein